MGWRRRISICMLIWMRIGESEVMMMVYGEQEKERS
jgi:hypothetical protein